MTVTPETIAKGEAFAHFGVKGMRWGVRKKEPSSDSDSASSEPEPYYQESNFAEREGRSRSRKIAKGLAITAVVAAGSIFAANYISKRGRVPVTKLASKMSSPTIAALKKATASGPRRLVPEATRLFEGQYYANSNMQNLGKVRLSDLK